MSIISTFCILPFLNFLVFPLFVWAGDEHCIRAVEAFLLLPKQNSPLTRSEGHRLASLIRSQAENIIHSETVGPTNIKWNSSLESFFSTYSSADGNKIDLIYTPEGLLESYRLKLNGVVTYHCNIIRQIDNVQKGFNKNARKKK